MAPGKNVGRTEQMLLNRRKYPKLLIDDFDPSAILMVLFLSIRMPGAHIFFLINMTNGFKLEHQVVRKLTMTYHDSGLVRRSSKAKAKPKVAPTRAPKRPSARAPNQAQAQGTISG